MPNGVDTLPQTTNPPSDRGSREHDGGQTLGPQGNQVPEERRVIRNPARATLRAGRKGASKAARFVGKKAGRGAIRAAAFAATAAPMLAAGAIAYAATGDAKYLGMGVGAAHALSGRAADAVLPKNGRFSDSKLAGAGRSIRTAYRRERMSPSEAAKQEKIDEFKRDKNNLEYIRQQNPNLSNKEAKNELNKTIEKGKDFIGANYNNIEDIQRLNKMKDETGLSSDQILVAERMASRAKDEDLMDKAKSQKIQNNLVKQIKAGRRKFN